MIFASIAESIKYVADNSLLSHCEGRKEVSNEKKNHKELIMHCEIQLHRLEISRYRSHIEFDFIIFFTQYTRCITNVVF